VTFTNATKPVLSLPLPAGSFIVHAKTLAQGSATGAGFLWVNCETGAGASTDTATVEAPLMQLLSVYLGSASLSMDFPLTAAAPTTVTMTCENPGLVANTEFQASALETVITAVQTSVNR
jgi:hypothetical protein